MDAGTSPTEHSAGVDSAASPAIRRYMDAFVRGDIAAAEQAMSEVGGPELGRQHGADLRRQRATGTATRRAAPRRRMSKPPRRLDRRLGCPRPGARRASSSSSARDGPDDPDEPEPGPSGRPLLLLVQNFRGESVELDAIPAAELVRDAVELAELHVDHRQLEVLCIAEAEERRVLEQMAASVNGGSA